MTLTTATETITAPKEPREWSLAQIERVLSRPIPIHCSELKKSRATKSLIYLGLKLTVSSPNTAPVGVGRSPKWKLPMAVCSLWEG